MMRISLLFLLVPILLISCNDDQPVEKTEQAIVNLFAISQNPDSTYLVSDQSRGQVFISQIDSIVTFEVQLENFLPHTIHAVHLHIGPCEEPGMHWNQGAGMSALFCNERSLGIPWAKPRAGDVGNVSVGYDGSGSYTLKTDLWRLNTLDSKDIIGTTVVIHGTFDDFTEECDPGHDHTHAHTNPKIACGTVELL